jgi:hypothetical protein
MTSPQQPAERPNGSLVKHTRTGYAGRPVVSILVREDDPRNPDELARWRPVEGNSRWLTWREALATGTVEPLFTAADVAAAAAARQHHREATAQSAGAQLSPDHYYWVQTPTAGRPRRGDLRLLAAVRDGVVQLYGTHQPAVVEAATMRLRRDSLRVTRTVGAGRRVLGLRRVHRRVGRLVEAGLLAQPVHHRGPGTPADGIGDPYLPTRAGLEALQRHRPGSRSPDSPAQPRVESLQPPRSHTGPGTPPPAAPATEGSAAAGGTRLAGPGVHTEIIDVDGRGPVASTPTTVAPGASQRAWPAAAVSHPTAHRQNGQHTVSDAAASAPGSATFAAGLEGTTELASAEARSFQSARRVLAQPPRTVDDRAAQVNLARDQLRDPATRQRGDAHLAARPQPGQARDPATSAGAAPPRPGSTARGLRGPRR